MREIKRYGSGAFSLACNMASGSLIFARGVAFNVGGVAIEVDSTHMLFGRFYVIPIKGGTGILAIIFSYICRAGLVYGFARLFLYVYTGEGGYFYRLSLYGAMRRVTLIFYTIGQFFRRVTIYALIVLGY